MKKNLLLATGLFTALLFSACSTTVDNSINGAVNVHDKGINLPEWQWTSGEVRKDSVAAKQAFTIEFNNSIYHPGDSVRIIFNSYKVTFTGITDITTFGRWIAKNTLLCSMNNKWTALVKDTNARINRPFVGLHNNRTDSLSNYQIHTVVPSTGSLVLSVSPGICEMDTIDGHGQPFTKHSGLAFITSIKGIEVEKL